jgi:hypothetical protein
MVFKRVNIDNDFSIYKTYIKTRKEREKVLQNFTVSTGTGTGYYVFN